MLALSQFRGDFQTLETQDLTQQCITMPNSDTISNLGSFSYALLGLLL